MEQERTRDGGFTMTELAVVLMVIGILVAMAIPTFMRVTERAKDTRTKSNVSTALKVARAAGVSGSYRGVDATALELEEGSLVFVEGDVASADAGVVSETVPDAAAEAVTVVVAAQSASGRCFFAQDSLVAGSSFAAVDGVPCEAASFTEVPAEQWLPRW